MVRGFAATYVFAGHLFLERILPETNPLRFLFGFGQEAVMLFFLISGFVIYYSTERRADITFREYALRRFLRIYPIFLIALVLSVLCARDIHVLGYQLTVRQVLGNLFMFQDFKGGKPGVFTDALGGNAPLWSLTYEWWFYMLFFPIYAYVGARARVHCTAILSLVGFMSYLAVPNQVSLILTYFILWWCGAELARAYLSQGRVTLRSQRWTVAYVGLFAACMAGQVIAAWVRRQPLAFGIHPILELRHFVACALFLLGAIVWSRLRWRGFERIFGAFAFVAPISYALYVFHHPLAVTANYLRWLPSPAVQLACYIGITVAAAYLAEARLQPIIARWFQKRVLLRSA